MNPNEPVVCQWCEKHEMYIDGPEGHRVAKCRNCGQTDVECAHDCAVCLAD